MAHSRSFIIAFFALFALVLRGEAALPNDFMPAKILFPGSFYEFEFPAKLLTPWFISTSSLTVGAVDGTQPLPAWIQWNGDAGKFTCFPTNTSSSTRLHLFGPAPIVAGLARAYFSFEIYVNYQTLPELNVSYIPPWGPESGYNVLPSAIPKASAGNMYFLDLDTLVIPGNADYANYTVSVSSTNPAVPVWLKLDPTVEVGNLLSGQVPKAVTQNDLDNLQQDVSVVMTDNQGSQLRFRFSVLAEAFQDGLPQTWTPKPKSTTTTAPPFTSKAIPTTMLPGATGVVKAHKITPAPDGSSNVQGVSDSGEAVSTGLSAGAIAGIVVGLLATLGLVIGGLIYAKNKRSTPPPSLGMYGENYYTSSRKPQDPETGIKSHGKSKSAVEPVRKSVPLNPVPSTKSAMTTLESPSVRVPPRVESSVGGLSIKIDTPTSPLNMEFVEEPIKVEQRDLTATARVAFYQSIPIPGCQSPSEQVYACRQGGPKLPTWCHLSAGSEGNALVLWGMPSEIDVTDVREVVEIIRRPRGMGGQMNEEVVAKVTLTVLPAALSKTSSMRSVQSLSASTSQELGKQASTTMEQDL